mmetsp:Transcript_103657/g.302533  ORF Transcript_103657/g.302533 Transcript_103657/m.302533 type:complete len:851 (+) Transcript_103657:240-2792(+)
MLVKISVQGFDNWALELELPSDTTVAKFKELIAAPPHSLEISAKTKVLWRRANNCLMALLDNEKVKTNIVLLNAAPTVISMTFPAHFVWGSATAAYQIEGALDKGGRAPSIWDTFAKKPGNIDRGDTAEVACDHYNRFREDVKLMKEIGLPAYRFSISWPRLLPEGRGDVNPDAVTFYRSLLEELAAHQIQAMVTLYHWDLPQCLEDEYGGWRGRQIVEDFEAFAAACFASFGDLVRTWITINEPWCAAVLGYASGEHAPGRKEAPLEEPYLVAHHMILAHARAVKRYRSEFKSKQNGRIGITLNMDWKEPLSSSDADLAAQSRALAWQLGWFADPIYRGHYPASMRNRCKERLPTFSEAEVKLIKGSADFFGLNHYSTDYVSPDLKPEPNNFFEDSEVKNTSDPNWAKTGIGWDIVPWGLGRLVAWIHSEYAPPGGIVVTENGCAVHEETAEAAQEDTPRVEYLQAYLTQLHKAIAAGAHVWGYFAWSLMDNFEWAYGYAKRFGLVRVDYETQERSLKASARTLAEVARDNTLRVPTGIVIDSEFAPISEKKEKAAPAPAKPHPKALLTPTTIMGDTPLTLPQAVHLLSELAEQYQAPTFQTAMEAAYQKFEQNGSNLSLSKARQALCLPIQSAVLPKYSFEPSTVGVHKSVLALRSPELAKDPQVQRLTAYVNFLISDLPQLRVRAEARRREQEEQLEVMEALGMGQAPPEKPATAVEGKPAEGEEWRRSEEDAKRVLEELLDLYQDKTFQDQLTLSWTTLLMKSDHKPMHDLVSPLWAKAWASCGLAPARDWDSAAWLPLGHENMPEIVRLVKNVAFLLKDLPDKRARMEAHGRLGKVLPFAPEPRP